MSDVYRIVGRGVEDVDAGVLGEWGEGEGKGVDCVVCVQVSGGVLCLSLFLFLFYFYSFFPLVDMSCAGCGRDVGSDELC